MRRGLALGRGRPGSSIGLDAVDDEGEDEGDEASGDEVEFEFITASLQEPEVRQFVFDQSEDV